MPQLDQTGPDGQGAMTGRKAGKCTNFGAGGKKGGTSENKNADDDLKKGGGRGRGGRGGAGRGARQGRQQGQGQGQRQGRGRR